MKYYVKRQVVFIELPEITWLESLPTGGFDQACDDVHRHARERTSLFVGALHERGSGPPILNAVVLCVFQPRRPGDAMSMRSDHRVGKRQPRPSALSLPRGGQTSPSRSRSSSLSGRRASPSGGGSQLDDRKARVGVMVLNQKLDNAPSPSPRRSGWQRTWRSRIGPKLSRSATLTKIPPPLLT